MKKMNYILTFLIFSFSGNYILSQNLDLTKKPKQEYLDSAKKIAIDVFENIKNRNYEEISEFMVESLGANWNESKKISQRNEYLSKFKIIGLNPPDGVYGDLNGYDLIDEGFLKGSDRLFRHTYITYHEGSFLIWEFRFYVDKNDNVNLHYIGWSDKNPFEYMSTPDMLLPRYN